MRVTRSLLALALAVGLAGCASTESAKGDADLVLCLREGRGSPAIIAACERVLTRPDPANTPDVYEMRGRAAIHLGTRLSEAGREPEALAANLRAIQLLERYERERVRPTTGEDAGAAAAAKLVSVGYYSAGLSAALLERWWEAAAFFRQAITRWPGNAFAWGALGIATNQTGDFKESDAAFAKAVELDATYFDGARASQRKTWDASRASRHRTLP